jgi:hypothetical protein
MKAPESPALQGNCKQGEGRYNITISQDLFSLSVRSWLSFLLAVVVVGFGGLRG